MKRLLSALGAIGALSFFGQAEAVTMVQTADGGMLLGIGNGRSAVLKLDARGQPATAFGEHGRVTTSPLGQWWQSYMPVLMPRASDGFLAVTKVCELDGGATACSSTMTWHHADGSVEIRQMTLLARQVLP